MRQIPHWISGREVAGTGSRRLPVFDPGTGEIQAEVVAATTEEVRTAVQTALAVQPAWRAASLSRRAEVMFRFRDLVDGHRKEIASLLSSEHGKTIADASGEVARGLENAEFAAGAPHLLKGGYSEQAAGGVDVYSIQQPLGVVAGITPFNFPAMVPMWMFCNALVAGNGFILKPSEKDPSVSLLLADLLRRAGLPDGVFNVVQGDKEAVDALLADPDVKAISFVGSTPVAQSIYETGTRNGKRVQALGGAKNHMVVLPDADVPAAADAAVSAGFGSAGERCMAVSVVVAVGTVGDKLVEEIATRINKIRVGAASDPDAEMGPLISGAHRDKVRSYLDGQGGEVVVDGRKSDISDSPGFFLAPSLVDKVDTASPYYTDEIFGPVLSVVRVDSYDEALKLVNDNPWGNGTAIFTRDGGAARRYQYDVDCGMVGVNVPIPVPVAYYSFGGWKASLFGDVHMYGPDGLRFYTRTKVVTSRWPDPATSEVDLGFPKVR
ncbi:malonate-semialdehyde dehydrogenase (acetylating)/methylmalonate-semialdehyde dehydrogenase [Asanoa ferruginea]|uniref:methylmalonate-semialdehyde dehydrogenase (CoA acylating) n=1 Tax=Asanoa ferruginea TaxID=53367 RepID=A0A3D9ZWK6_9ACTN|nr:CoA-acylating methylmalonate-semialdehyde dehydrogenase [Asanoa ferruginea]REG01599.1 malonate-semialdehyde dehydrogenase (acetylating)/methylmalonate-semialdehyde dehydrogenase [Asanoa ferruginea]GIF53230.1 methylmalonate-semialdehyde dehydrogenase (acylating) [Asanoa ferruginea]